MPLFGAIRLLARNMGIAQVTICARSKRGNWTAKLAYARAQAPAQQPPAISTAQGAATSLYDRGQRHVEKMAALSEREIPTVTAMEGPELLDSIERVDRFDRLARRQYGLESASGERVGLQINILSSPTIESHGTPLIEVETIENEP